MATKTLELVLQLEADKSPSATELVRWVKNLEDEADKLKKKISDAVGQGNASEAKKLQAELRGVETQMRDIDSIARKRTLEKSIVASQKAADNLRNKMEKVAQVGNRIALAGTAMLAPFAMAVSKYVSATGESEETSRKIIEAQKEWEQIQIRIGRVAAEQLLPFLEKALDVADGIAAFAEAHPDAVKAALAIAGSMVVIGGGLSMASSIVGTLATVQGLAAGAGLAGGAAGAAGTAGVAGAGLASTLSAAFIAAAPYIAVALAVVIAAELTRVFMNGLLGTNQTWSDIGTTMKRVAVLVAEGWDGFFAWLGLDTNFSASIADALGIADVPKAKQVTDIAKEQNSAMREGFNSLGGKFGQLGNGISQALGSVGNGIVQAIASIPGAFSNAVSALGGYISGRRADGGYASSGLYTLGERGSEFVMSNNATRAAEGLIGGRLTQDNLLSALAGGGARRIEYHDSRRIDSSLSLHDRQIIKDDIMNALAGAL